MAESDITVEILKGIREATRTTNARLDSMEGAFSRRLDVTNERLDVITDRMEIVTERLDVMTERLDLVETTLLDSLVRTDSSAATPGSLRSGTPTSIRASARSRAASKSSNRSRASGCRRPVPIRRLG